MQSLIALKAGTHYPYVRAVRNDRTYGPYVRASFFAPVRPARTYGRSLRSARVNVWHP